MKWLRVFIALPITILLSGWLLLSVVNAIRNGKANATGTIIFYRKRPLFFIVTIIVQFAFAISSLLAAMQIVAYVFQNDF